MKAIPIIRMQEQPTERVRACQAHQPKTKRNQGVGNKERDWYTEGMRVVKEMGVYDMYQ